MPLIYNPKDVFVVQRNDTSSSFVETILRSTPNSVVMFDSGSTITTLSTASLAQSIVTASLSNFTASNAVHATNADTASFLLEGANIYLSASAIHSVISVPTPPFETGQLYWQQPDHTYAIDTDVAGLDLKIGQQQFTRVIAGEFIPAGSVVYINGTGAGLPLVFLALADGTGTKSSVAGICPTNLSTGDEGFIVSSGRAENINTFTLPEGSLAYLSSTFPGGLQSTPPVDPFEKVIVGPVLLSNPTSGKLLVNISTQPPLTSPYVGMIEVPTFTDHHNQTFTVGSAQANFCTTPDGLGQIKTFTIPEAGFTASIGVFAEYVLGTYNGGNPIYIFTNDKSLIDETQTIPVFSTITPVAGVNFTDWDTSGTLLANKQDLRIIQIYGVQRASGLILGVSGSYITVTSGSVWYGVKHLDLLTVDTSNTASFPLSFYSHTSGSWVTTAIPTGQFINGQYDDGTDLQILSSGSYVVNYIYRATSNRTIITLSDQFTNLAEADIASPPDPPSYFPDFTVLVGRIVAQSGSTNPAMVNSIFKTVFSPTQPPYHNDLQGLQGGSGSNEFYHLDSASFANIANGSSATASVALTASIANTASLAIFSQLASTASVSDTASFIRPGATLFVVGDNTNQSASYIEPFNIPDYPYNPPFKEGRMFYDPDFCNWVYYPEQNFKLHIGKELLFRIHNPFNTTLTETTVIYLSGSTAGLNLPDAYPAIADGTGLHASPVGIVRADIPSGSIGYALTNGVIHNINSGQFEIGDTLWLSSTIPGGMQNFQPNSPSEAVRIGTCQQSGSSDGSFFVRIITIPSSTSGYGGAVIPPVITNNNDGTITISTGSVNLFSDPLGFGSVVEYPIPSTILTLVTGSTNYINADYNSGNPIWSLTTDSTINNGTTTTRIAKLDILFNDSETMWDIHEFDVGIVGLALSNRLNNKDIHLFGYQRESGLTLFTTGSNGDFGVTSGIIWYGPNSHDVPEFNTTVPGNEAYHFFVNSSSVWTLHTQSVYDNQSYNDTGGLAPLAPNSWSVNFVYRIIADVDNDDVAIVLSSQQFPTELEASNNAVPPSDLPSTISDFGFLVGRFVVQSGSFTNTVVNSTFSPLFVPAVVTNHENLLGLQGGAAGQHEHLTTLEYSNFQNASGTGVYVRQTGSILTNAHITGSITSASSANVSNLSNTASVALFTNVFAGPITDILLTDNGSGSVIVSTSSVNLFSDPDGNSTVVSYSFPTASFPVASGSANYVIANYNGGSPIYQILTDPSIINQTTVVPISVVSNIRGEIRGYNFDNVGSALANRLNDRLSRTEKFTRQSGLQLFDTASFIGITQGVLWDGATQISEPDFNSMYFADSNPVVNENYFYHHTSSLPSGSFIVELDTTASNQWVSNFYDTGTDLAPMSSSFFVVNYVWRLVGGISADEDSSTVIGSQYATLNEAKAEAVPFAPPDVTELGVLVGRAILQSGSSTPVVIESAFASTFQASTVTNHENLDGLQGGTSGQHEHLTTAEYTGTGTGVFVRQNGASISGSITTSSFATTAQTASFITTAQTASFATLSQTASFSALSQTASFSALSQTASFVTLAQTASFVQLSQQAVSASNAITASWADKSPATTLFTASIYQITSSVSVTSLTAAVATTASFASNARSASSALSAVSAATASFALGIPAIKSGILSGSQFQGAPRTASVVFATPFIDNNYSITVTGETSRTWTIQNKVSGSFQINSNNNGAIANNTFWHAIYAGEYYS